jgi:phosphate transport system substrate-binding protein
MKNLFACAVIATGTLLSSCSQSHAGAEIENIGSDTLLEVAGALAEKYAAIHPEVPISVAGGGSAVGVAALIADDCEIANCSRPLKEKEIANAKKNGVDPIQHTIGYDGIAVFVHKDNPLESLTMDQLKALFGEGGKIESWQDLGIDMGNESANVIQLGSRQNNSGTYECFREKVLGKKGRFKQRCNNLNGSKDVVKFCADSKSAIGYSGLAYKTDDVRIVPIAPAKGSDPIAPTVETVQAGTYPIARPLFMYTNGEPKNDIGAYMQWIKGTEGQKVLSDKGYVPLKR